MKQAWNTHSVLYSVVEQNAVICKRTKKDKMSKQVKIIRKTHLLCCSNQAAHNSLQTENLIFLPSAYHREPRYCPTDKPQTLLPHTRNQRDCFTTNTTWCSLILELERNAHVVPGPKIHRSRKWMLLRLCSLLSSLSLTDAKKPEGFLNVHPRLFTMQMKKPAILWLSYKRPVL